jgi:hypothetical protein
LQGAFLQKRRKDTTPFVFCKYLFDFYLKLFISKINGLKLEA